MQNYNIQDVDMLDEVEHNGIPTIDHHVTIVNNKYVIDPCKKYIRTTLKLDDGTYVSARINTETGEVKPYTYTKKSKLVITKPKQNVVDRITDYYAEGNLLGYEPSWLHVSKTERDIAATTANGKKPRSWKTMANPNRTILADFSTMQEACAEFPWLEDILFGVTHLDDSDDSDNTRPFSMKKRPFSMKKFFYMLRDLDEINVETIYAYTAYSKSHCYKVAKHIRVLIAAFNSEVTRKGLNLKLLLTAVENKTTKNGLPFFELTFKYPDKEKVVKYCVWSFIHNKENGLEAVWDKAQTAKVGSTYDIHYQKLVFQEQLHFVITCLDIVPS